MEIEHPRAFKGSDEEFRPFVMNELVVTVTLTIVSFVDGKVTDPEFAGIYAANDAAGFEWEPVLTMGSATSPSTTKSDTEPTKRELPPMHWQRHGDSWISEKPRAEVRRVGERHWGRLEDQWLKAEDGGHAEYETADEGKAAVSKAREKHT